VPDKRGFANQLGFAIRGAANAKRASGEAGIFLKLDIFVVRVTARGIEEQQTKSVARPAIVPEKALEPRFLDARLFVNGGNRGGRVVGDFAKARMNRAERIACSGLRSRATRSFAGAYHARLREIANNPSAAVTSIHEQTRVKNRGSSASPVRSLAAPQLFVVALRSSRSHADYENIQLQEDPGFAAGTFSIGAPRIAKPSWFAKPRLSGTGTRTPAEPLRH